MRKLTYELEAFLGEPIAWNRELRPRIIAYCIVSLAEESGDFAEVLERHFTNFNATRILILIPCLN